MARTSTDAAPTAMAQSAKSTPESASRTRPASQAKPPIRILRSLNAYWVTFRVIASYLSVRMQSRFRGEAAIAQLLVRKHRRNARRIERTIVLLQGMYIKVGQLISIMTNFLPEEFRSQLEGLQDAAPPRAYKDIEARICEEFGGKAPGQLFDRFEERPIASASIGQVHVAYLSDGRKVAVKVQYPDIERVVHADLRTLRRILRIVSFFVPYQGLDGAYREIRTMLLEELDFRREAENIDRVAAHLGSENVRRVVVPTVIPELSTTRVLTTLFEDGVKISEVDRLQEAGYDLGELAELVVESYCKQIFTGGAYHADPHPGNLLVRRDDDGRACVVFLDFGAVGTISQEMREGIVEFLQGALARDTGRVVKAMKQMGFIARGADTEVFDKVVEYFHQQFQDQLSLDSLNLKDIKFNPQKGLDSLADLRNMDVSLRELTENFDVPKEWILLERTLLLLMGLCTALAPQMNPMTVIRPHIERFVLGDEGDWSAFLVETAKSTLMTVTALPGEMQKFMTSTRRGELSVRVQNLGHTSQMLYSLGHQLMFTGAGIAGAAIAVVLEGRNELARAEVGWWTAKVCAALLVVSLWRSRSLLRRR